MGKKGIIKFEFEQEENGLAVSQKMENVSSRMVLGGIQCLVDQVVEGMEEETTLKHMSKMERIERTYDILKEMHLVNILQEEKPNKEELLYMLDKLRQKVNNEL